MRCLPAECSFGHAIDKASVLEFDQGPLSRSSCDIASLGSSADGEAEPAVVGAIVAPRDFAEDGTVLIFSQFSLRSDRYGASARLETSRAPLKFRVR
jgi:hypothetical protein